MRSPALRARFRSLLSVGVAGIAGLAASLLCSSRASAQYATTFDSLMASPGGTLLTGQDNFTLPITPGTDWFVYTYAGNTLSIPVNPFGGANFVAGNPPTAATALARAERTVPYATPCGKWTLAIDVLGRYTGTGVPVNNLASISLQPSTTSRYFIMLGTWPATPTGTTWDADFIYWTAANVQTQVKLPDPAFQGLATNKWYRWETDFDLGSNEIIQIRLTDRLTNVTVSHTPSGWYLWGGSAPTMPLPTAVRMFAGGADNLLACDNLDLRPMVSRSTIYGCANPANSLTVVSGIPRIGTTITLGIHNPLGTMLHNSPTALLIGGSRDANPCGLLLGGFGMAVGIPGELLIGNLTSLVVPGPNWHGTTVSIGLPIPGDCYMVGKSLFFQGVMVGASGSQVPVGLTRAAELRFGDS